MQRQADEDAAAADYDGDNDAQGPEEEEQQQLTHLAKQNRSGHMGHAWQTLNRKVRSRHLHNMWLQI